MQRPRAGNRIAAEGRAVKSGRKNVLYPLAKHRSSNRKSAAQTLCRGDDIGSEAVIHICVKPSAASVAALNLVVDKQDTPLLCQLYRRTDEILIKRKHSSLSAHRLKHHRGGIFVNGFKQCGSCRLDRNKALGQRQEVTVKHLLTRRRKRGQRPAVKAVFKRNDLIASGALAFCRIFTRRLYCTFVSLRTRICKKHLFHSGAAAKLGGKTRARLGIIKI